MKKQALAFAGWIFAVMALVHLARSFYPFAIIIGSFSVPEWLSPAFFILAGLASSWMFWSRYNG